MDEWMLYKVSFTYTCFPFKQRESQPPTCFWKMPPQRVLTLCARTHIRTHVGPIYARLHSRTS